MSAADLLSIVPLLILAAGSILTMLLVAIIRSHKLAFVATAIVLAASFVSLFFPATSLPHAIGDILHIDSYGHFFTGIMLIAAFIVKMYAFIGFNQMESTDQKEEFYLLLMLSTLGACFLAYSTHFISLFIGLETLSVSLYTMIAYYRKRSTAIEAGVKYLVLAALSSAFLLFGMALIYAVGGTMAFAELSNLPEVQGPYYLLLAGIGLMTVGIGFKLALVPFHMWTPDVYQGASSSVTAFIATVSKGGMVAVVLRFLGMNDIYLQTEVIIIFTALAILSMLIGNFLALLQNNVKRILAYSSIAHFGYLLVAFVAGGELGIQAATFYLVTYFATILGAFGLVTLISKGQEEAENIYHYQGLFWRKPALAACFTVFLLSLAGIPLTAGFIGKYYLLTAGIYGELRVLAIVLVLSSVIGLYYYLRVIVTMLKQPDGEAAMHSLSVGGSLALAVLNFVVVWIGVLPEWLMQVVSAIW
jgi:NADH-quinone oxidoreductase subunit N